jgi:hypothetical protein
VLLILSTWLSPYLELVSRVFALSLAFCSATLLSAQNPSAIPPQIPLPALSSHQEWPKVNPADVSTIEDTVQAFYSAISTPAGGKLDRNRLRSLFVPDGRIVVSRPPRFSRAADIIFLSPDEYANISDAQTVTGGFLTKTLPSQVEKSGVMAHLYSTYESRSHPEDESRWPAASSRSNCCTAHTAGTSSTFTQIQSAGQPHSRSLSA